ncbi:alpha/beta fold hydrolase [Larkinella soli]|uniref:alpha/beta fold hydrolase n=1 Tax=Larkinella soli TaxID=1770527 RepID=UPI000FFC6650|nr:alpha/beta fold hydrolase [Larkinella soli]
MNSQPPVVVLIHGHGVDSAVWNALYEDLKGEYTVLKPDFSEHTDYRTIEAYAGDLYGRLQTIGAEACVLIGHSMGGYIALALAESHPERVRGLILFSSTAFADDESRREGRRKAVETLETRGAAPFIGETVPKMFGDSYSREHPEEVDRLVARYSGLPAEALASGVKAMAARPDRTEVLKKAAFPVLIVAGGEDKIIPPEKSRALFSAAPQARTQVLEKVGHLGMIEQPEETRKVIRDFLSSL